MSNHTRVIPSGVSIRAWHQTIDSPNSYSLHVDLGFSVGCFGGGAEDLIQFEVRIARAHLSISKPEYVKVKQNSIASSVSPDLVSARNAEETTAKSSAGLLISAQPSAELLGEVGSTKSISTEEAGTRFKVVSVAESSGHGWEISGTEAYPFLHGSPWEPVENPRFVFRSEVDPSEIGITARLTCRLKDIHFENFQIFEKRFRIAGVEEWKESRLNPELLAAARQFVKLMLGNVNLEMALHSEFAPVVLADVVVLGEWA